MRTFAATFSALMLALTALVPTLSAKQPSYSAPHPYQIIVHPRNPSTSVERKFVKDAFLKKTTRWPNDKLIRPADLTPGSAARSRFSKEVLARSTAAVKAYWQQRIFSGRDVPPPEFESDDRIVAHVLKYEGAIGYVSGTASLKGSKAVTVSR